MPAVAVTAFMTLLEDHQGVILLHPVAENVVACCVQPILLPILQRKFLILKVLFETLDKIKIRCVFTRVLNEMLLARFGEVVLTDEVDQHLDD